MKLRLQRSALLPSKTIGTLELYKDDEWVYLCDTIEHKYIPENNKRPTIRSRSKTALEPGEYKITMLVDSPIYIRSDIFPQHWNCKGCMPRIIGGNKESVITPIQPIVVGADIMVGKLSNKNTLSLCVPIWEALMKLYLRPAKRYKDQITIEIINPS